MGTYYKPNIYKKDDVFFVDEPSKNYMGNILMCLPSVMKDEILNTYLKVFNVCSSESGYEVSGIYKLYADLNYDDVASLISTFSLNSIYMDNYRLEFIDGSLITMTRINNLESMMPKSIVIDNCWLVRFLDATTKTQIAGIICFYNDDMGIFCDTAYCITKKIRKIEELYKNYWCSNGSYLLSKVVLFMIKAVTTNHTSKRIVEYTKLELDGYKRILDSLSTNNKLFAYIESLYGNETNFDIASLHNEFNELVKKNIPQVALNLKEWQIVDNYFNENYRLPYKACNLVEALSYQPFGDILSFPINEVGDKIYVVPKVSGSTVEFLIFLRNSHLYITRFVINNAQTILGLDKSNIASISTCTELNQAELPSSIDELSKGFHPYMNEKVLQFVGCLLPLYTILHERPVRTSTRSRVSKNNNKNTETASETGNNNEATVIDSSVVKHILRYKKRHSNAESSSEPSHHSETSPVRNYVMDSWPRAAHWRRGPNGKSIYISEQICYRRIKNDNNDVNRDTNIRL